MVEGGTVIARHFGIGERVIGLTIVALGTSLPELAATLAAVRKGRSGLAVGNVLGSCLFNLAFVMGAASLITPLAVEVDAMTWDLTVMVALTGVMWMLLKSARETRRRDGVFLLSAYGAFMAYLASQTFMGS
jgi:cation:H+ antiporter